MDQTALMLLLCLCSSALQDGETVGSYRAKEGESITVTCKFKYYGTKTFLCKETCEGENILIETTKDRDERGRFSIRYEERGPLKSEILHVSIADLKPSDSGWYWCRSDKTVAGTIYDRFDLRVTEDSSKPKWTPGTFLGSTFLPTSTQSFSPYPSETIKLSEKPAAASDSSKPKWTPGTFLGSTFLSTASTTTKSTIRMTTSTQSFSPSPSETIKLCEKPAAASGQQLYAILSNVVKIVLLSTPLVIFCWKRRTMKSKDSAVETENADEIFTVYS